MPAAQVANMETDDPLQGAIEILPDRLYFNTLRHDAAAAANSNGRRVHCFSIDDELVYWNFFHDFGPLNLGQLFRFCAKLNSKLGGGNWGHDRNGSSSAGDVVCYYCRGEAQKRANAIFLICAWKILFLDQTPEESFYPFRAVNMRFKKGEVGPMLRNGSSLLEPILPFHDASPGVCTYDLSILDVLKGLAKARTHGFFQDFKSGRFDIEEYEHFEMVENGDLNWIIDGQFLAFAGPQNRRQISTEGYVTLTPDDYVGYFQRRNVGLVVRLNKKCYDEEKFMRGGVDHVEHFYVDGSVPTKKILNEVLSSFEKCIFHPGQLGRSGKAVAVHCKAGLGRTGTCIGAYMMKHYKFTAAEAIGWMRLCRPGCVIGPQQHFLSDIEHEMWHDGGVMRLKVQRSIETSCGKSHNVAYNDESIECSFEDVNSIKRGSYKSRPILEKSQGNCSKPGITSVFHSMAIRVPTPQDMQDAILGRAGQGEALRAARTGRSPSGR